MKQAELVSAGVCCVCHHPLFAEVDGYDANDNPIKSDPDPRGDVSEREARVTLTPDRTGGKRTVYACYRCANDGNAYRKACELAGQGA